jgi:hypothetical protein
MGTRVESLPNTLWTLSHQSFKNPPTAKLIHKGYLIILKDLLIIHEIHLIIHEHDLVIHKSSHATGLGGGTMGFQWANSSNAR